MLGRVDEFEVFPTKSVGYRKTDFSRNGSNINDLLLIRQHALDLWVNPERFELGCQALGPLAFLLSTLAFSLYERGHPDAVCIVKA